MLKLLLGAQPTTSPRSDEAPNSTKDPPADRATTHVLGPASVGKKIECGIEAAQMRTAARRSARASGPLPHPYYRPPQRRGIGHHYLVPPTGLGLIDRRVRRLEQQFQVKAGVVR